MTTQRVVIFLAMGDLNRSNTTVRWTVARPQLDGDDTFIFAKGENANQIPPSTRRLGRNDHPTGGHLFGYGGFEPIKYNSPVDCCSSPVGWGRHITLYEATQRQRKIERAIRKQKQNILLDEKLGDKDKLQADQIKLQVLKQEYSRFSKAADLPMQYERMEKAGFDWKHGKAAERAAKEGAQRNDSMARLPKKPVEKSRETDIIDAGNINRIDLEEGRSVQRVISNVLKTDVGNIKLDGLPVQAQRYVLTATRKVLNKFPQLQGYTRGISYDPGISAIAQSQSLRGNILLSSDFLDLEKMQKRHNYNIKLKAHPKGTEDIASIIVHEYGHQLDGWLTKKGVYGGSISEHGIVRTSEAVQREVLRRVGLTDARRREIRAEWAARGYTGKDLADAVKWECDGFITDNLSDYATVNHKEFFAECFSEYMMNPEPREIARVFGELLEEIMEGIS